MKNRNFLLTAMLLTFGAGTAVTAVQGDTYRTERQSLAAIAPTLGTDGSAALADLAADLAKTAARLAELQNAQPSESQHGSAPMRQTAQPSSNVESARQFNSTRNAKETTVRWLGSKADASYQSGHGAGNTQEVQSYPVR
ncbi:MAG: hypothetical protein GXP28_10055, partial [Planctomycetes bacterium]|nr:hypothetical protein [Planctomycetota bacterium]